MTDKTHILVVDDEQTLCEALRFNLELEDYDVLVAHSGEEALSLPGLKDVDLVLLDVMMDGIDGFETARRLRSRAETRDVPIIFLTAKDTEEDMLRGLHTGADDYIAKPYSIRNVLARVRAVLRRAARGGEQAGEPSGELTYEGITVDTGLKQVRIDGREVHMPRKEYEILLLLLSDRGRIFTRDEILSRVWEDGVVVVDRTVDVNITRLRQKLGPYGRHIVTRSGYGYGFVE